MFELCPHQRPRVEVSARNDWPPCVLTFRRREQTITYGGSTASMSAAVLDVSRPVMPDLDDCRHECRAPRPAAAPSCRPCTPFRGVHERGCAVRLLDLASEIHFANPARQSVRLGDASYSLRRRSGGTYKPLTDSGHPTFGSTDASVGLTLGRRPRTDCRLAARESASDEEHIAVTFDLR